MPYIISGGLGSNGTLSRLCQATLRLFLGLLE
jgi:hypothetical protein